ncbi:MAG: hypothetical protein IKN54_04280 [Lachnospiraceae bacterium]|nr:hypothetical protein [Lachnospiraceae bacterium]
MRHINVIFEEISKKTELILNEYLRQKYFLVVLGSIFLLGIVAKAATVSIYDRLLQKSENMLSTKNKTLRQIKIKYENSKTVNGSMANPSLMVERYIAKYKFMGISLKSISGITQKCGLICLLFGAVAGLYVYDVHKMFQRAVVYVIAGGVMAYWLDLFARSGDLVQKHNEIVYIITDFLENRMDIRDKRIERVAELSKELDELSESNAGLNISKKGAMTKNSSDEHRVTEKEFTDELAIDGVIKGRDRLVYNPQPEVIHVDMEEWEKELKASKKSGLNKRDLDKLDLNKLEYQELIINEVLAEFL